MIHWQHELHTRAMTADLFVLSTIDCNTVYAKPRLSQVKVRKNLSATGRHFEFTCHNDR